jgi:hypothetical protein
MSLAQNSPPDAWLPAERARDLREPLRLPAVAGSPRLCVILDHAVTLAAPSADTPTAPARRGGPTRRGVRRRLQLRHLLQMPELLRSIDYGGLMGNLSPFRINTSKFPEVLIIEDL